MTRILVAEDETIARKNLAHILKKEGYEVIEAADGARAVSILETTGVDLVLTDLKMKGADGIAVLERAKKLQPDVEVILITGYATVNSAVKALKMGAYHYISKPYKIDELRKIVSEALLKRRLLLENRELKRQLKAPGEVPFFIGNDSTVIALKKTITRIAPTDTNVLVVGESGTGKELVARAIHELSPRADKPFVAFNCGSFTEELMANELFGHEKGAFTGAQNEKKGLLETANGGTVFLDEVGDMPPTMQVKLLRAIQEKVIFRVGGTKPISTDVRFIAATHRDLKKEIERGRFRQDLFYRLNVITIEIPPLSARAGDIPLLALHFLEQKAKAMGKEITGIDPGAMALLKEYTWPGNVRELENVIERAVALAAGPVITADDLPEDLITVEIETYRRNPSKIPTLEEQEKKYIKWVLERCRGNKSAAAKLMGIDRVSLWRKMKRYGIE